MLWNRAAGLWAAAAIAAGLGIALALALAPDPEVTWSRRLALIGCDAAKHVEDCHAWVSVSVGNTGNVDQPAVRVQLPGARSEWRIQSRASDIRASLVKRTDPVIARLDGGDAVVYEIRPLPANVVVDLNGFCFSCAPEAVRRFAATQIEVQAEGRVREGDPRVATLAKALLHFAAGLWPW